MYLADKQRLNGTNVLEVFENRWKTIIPDACQRRSRLKNQSHALMLSDPGKRVPEMAEGLKVSVGLCFIILTENSRMRHHVSAEFILRVLTF
jgi:hypothetical protein